MKGVLYIGHGTRVKEGNEQVKSLAEKVKDQVPVPVQETAFLELAAPTIPEGVKRCVAQGVTELYVVPVLLFSARHLHDDIPAELSRAQHVHPELTIQLGDALGIRESLLQIVSDHLTEAGILQDSGASRLVLVGRGSSEEAVVSQVKEITEILKNRHQFNNAATCFLAAANPPFQETMHQSARQEEETVYVVPYLLFTGLLMQEIHQVVQNVQHKHLHKTFKVCPHLGAKEALEEVIVEHTKAIVQTTSSNQTGKPIFS
ncbi:sirohydrochlorin chelatase [Salsuginibacillus kocurii]|uniref:sirohydrochlorin chelatase n=1 Tax=Salsuginibacillus kocurii TaxID=427078 RepID=UPI000373E1F7|nr:sirohydrochlorin chelatase [Salsuginibacillus kocurii]